MKPRSYYHIILLFFLSISIHAQYRFDSYKHLTQKDGLPHNYCTDIVEDQDGFIWVGTVGGLARYDGSTFHPFAPIDTNATTFPSNDIESLEIHGDSLWVGTLKGVSILNLETGEVSNLTYELKFQPQGLNAASIDQQKMVWDLYKDRQNNIWFGVGFGGFMKWDYQTKKIINYPLYPDPEAAVGYNIRDQTTIYQLIQDTQKDSIMWGVGIYGLVKLNHHTGEIKRILFDRGDDKIKSLVNRKISIYQSPNGIIYMGSWHGGLSIYNPKTEEYRFPKIDFPKKDQHHHLYKIIPGAPNILYLTYGDGLYHYDIQNGTFKLLKENVVKGRRVSFGVNFIDSQNRAWHNSPNGLILHDPMVHQFNWHSVAEANQIKEELIPRTIIEDFHPGYLTIFGQYTEGIFHVNPTTGQTLKQGFNDLIPPESPFLQIWGAVTLDSNALLFSAANKLYRLPKGENNPKLYSKQIQSEQDGIKRLVKDSSGTIWMGTNQNGVFSLDPKTGNHQSFKNEIPYAKVFKPFIDSYNNVWYLTNFGHLVFRSKDQKIYDFNFNDSPNKTYIVSRNICECPNGEIWISGRDKGMGLLDGKHPEKGIIKKIRPTNREGKFIGIHRITCSSDNELWAIANGGVTKINRSNWSSETYSFEYGVKNSSGMFQFLKSGELFIGSKDGFYTVDPLQLKRNIIPPKIYVSKISTNKENKNRLEDHLNQKPVFIHSDENILNIEFSAINFTLAAQTKFLYQLEGIDEDWKDPGKKRELTYTFLPGGDYVFKLKACNNEGIWSDSIYRLPIKVGTPWYKTLPFGLSVLVLILGVGYLLYHRRIRQIQKANEIKSNFEMQVASLEMNALRAQMNPHFIFNCLNSIEAYIIRNDTRKASEYLNTFGRLVRLILQNSRTAYINLEDELEALSLYLHLEQMRFKTTFSYEIRLSEGLNPADYEIPPMLIQPFVENAIWHGLNHKEEGGHLTVEINQIGEMLQCIIEDNGIGREASKKYREAQKIKRQSMGMNITMGRMETLNKIYHTKNEVEIEDLYTDHGEAAGTRITLTIPL